VVDGTVVSPHDRVDDDIKAEVEKELGNEAFREQVRDCAAWRAHGHAATDCVPKRTCVLLLPAEPRARAPAAAARGVEAKADRARHAPPGSCRADTMLPTLLSRGPGLCPPLSG
jgi:hypothetical protein